LLRGNFQSLSTALTVPFAISGVNIHSEAMAMPARVEVKHRCAAPKRYTWEIFSEGKTLPLKESTDQFRSWEEASRAGKKVLKKLLANTP
jgi:hypothetical protein